MAIIRRNAQAIPNPGVRKVCITTVFTGDDSVTTQENGGEIISSIFHDFSDKIGENIRPSNFNYVLADLSPINQNLTQSLILAQRRHGDNHIDLWGLRMKFSCPTQIRDMHLNIDSASLVRFSYSLLKGRPFLVYSCGLYVDNPQSYNLEAKEMSEILRSDSVLVHRSETNDWQSINWLHRAFLNLQTYTGNGGLFDLYGLNRLLPQPGSNDTFETHIDGILTMIKPDTSHIHVGSLISCIPG